MISGEFITICTIKAIGAIVVAILGARIGSKMRIGTFPVAVLFALAAIQDLAYFRNGLYNLFPSQQHNLAWVRFLNSDAWWSLIVVVIVVILAIWAHTKATAEADLKKSREGEQKRTRPETYGGNGETGETGDSHLFAVGRLGDNR